LRVRPVLVSPSFSFQPPLAGMKSKPMIPPANVDDDATRGKRVDQAMVKEELKLDQRRKQRETTDVVFMFWLRFRNRSGGNVDKRRSFGIQFETKNVATLHRSTMILRLKRFGSRYNRITLEHSNPRSGSRAVLRMSARAVWRPTTCTRTVGPNAAK
jgi:hypothetical protein